MSLRNKSLKGGVLLGGGQAVSQGCSFLRNVIVARLLSPADFGIAAIFAMTLSLLEMIGNVASEKLLIQADDGNEQNFQSTAQLLLFGRGLFSAVALLFCAEPASRLFGVPGASWAFYALALAPFLRGLMHLDMYRRQREMDYRPAVTVDIASGLFALILAFPLAWWLRDYSAMLWIIIGQAGVTVLASHLVAQRRYAWHWDPGYARRVISFGWPLLINGFLMLGIFQGDRFIIGSANRLFHRAIYSLSDLGVYSVAFALTLAPTLIVATIASALWLPLLSGVKNVPVEFNKRYAVCCQVVAVVGALIALPLILCGGSIVRLIYGHSYAPASSFIGWLAAMQAIRIIRVSPTLAAMSKGDTRNTMISNLFRSSALGAAIIVAYLGGSLVWISAAGFFGEVFALTISVWRLHRIQMISPLICLRPVALTGLFLILAGIFGASAIGESVFGQVLLCVSLVAGLCVAMLLFPVFRRMLSASWADLLIWKRRLALNPFLVRQ